MTQEFHISITLVRQNQYLVRTEQVAPGVPLAEALVTLPLADWLTQTEQLMNAALKAVFQGNEKQLVGEDSGSCTLDSCLQTKIINLGQQLYNALFQGTIKDSWITAQEIAQREQEVLQLRLGLNEPLLARLPWEILYAGDRFLAIDEIIAAPANTQRRENVHPSIVFSCYQIDTLPMAPNRGETIGMPTPGLQQGVVKVLIAIAMPNLQDSLAFKQEAIKLQAELRKLSQADWLLNESASGLTATSGADSVGSDAGETPSQLEEEMSGFIDPAAALDLLDEEEWDEGVDVGYDDPTYDDDSALVSDLFRQLANQPAGVESPIFPDSTLDQLPEVTSSETQSLRSEIPQIFTNHSHKSAEACPVQSEESTPAATDTSTEQLRSSASPLGIRGKKARRPGNRGAESFKGLLQPDSRRFLPVLQAVGVIAIALVGFWWLQNREPQQISHTPIPSLSQPANNNLQTVSISELQAIATEHFNKGNLSAGCLAVEELLNRGALQSANTALNAVSRVQAKTSAIKFLRGRLAWQSIKIGDKNYSLDDVRRYWETAVKDKPDSPQYHNALSFVYYIQGDLNRANQIWFQALYLIEEQQAKTATFNPSVAKRDELNAYAGLALVLSKLAKNQPNDKQAKLLSEAINLRQKVLMDDPVNFQPQTLSQTWLWTEKAIQDWRSLLKLKAQ